MHVHIDGTETPVQLRAVAALLVTLSNGTDTINPLGKVAAAAPTTAAPSAGTGKPPGRPRKAATTSPEDAAAAKLRAKQAAEAAAEDAAEQAEDGEDSDGEEAEGDGAIDKEAVATVLGQLVDNGQRETVAKLLAKHGAKSISSLPESAYAAVHAAASTLL